MLRQWVIQICITWAINAFALILTSKMISSIRLKGIGSAFLATFVLAALNASLLRILWVITLPFTVLTLGLFLFILNGAMLKLTAGLVRGFKVEGWWSAIGGSIILSIIQAILYYFYRRTFEHGALAI